MRGAWRLAALVVAVALAIPVAMVGLSGSGDEEGAGKPTAAVTTGAAEEVGPGVGEPLPDPEPGEGRARAEDRKSARERERGAGRAPDYPTTDNVAYPNDVTAEGAGVARIVNETLGPSPGAPPALIGADCRDGTCSARYVSGPHGRGRQLDAAVQILRRLFARRGVKRVKLYIHEPQGPKSPDVKAMALLVVACDSTTDPSYEWSRINRRQIARRCTREGVAPGKAGSRVRQGRVSEKETSRGRADGG
ncbi:MAG TPA: hypothetical protein VGW10_15500, partial [Solirubrobacteraceae bacterium]|nr:hypothetical protein [Solirubrobacteraceae bacterium]